MSFVTACGCCVKAGVGATIDHAVDAIKHHPECDYKNELPVHIDCKDTKFLTSGVLPGQEKCASCGHPVGSGVLPLDYCKCNCHIG